MGLSARVTAACADPQGTVAVRFLPRVFRKRESRPRQTLNRQSRRWAWAVRNRYSVVDVHGRMVDVSLNIKNQQAHRLARELASATGENLTTAVTVALQERLERVRRQNDGGLAERLLAIGRDCAAHLREPYRSADHGDLLYDERGLPQ